MDYASFRFFLFLICMAVGEAVIPGTWRPGWLLLGSFIFYISETPAAALIIGSEILVSFFGAIIIERNNSGKKRKSILALLLILILFPLIFYKYSRFFGSMIPGLLTERLNAGFEQILIPLGISFFTFQASAYLIDVYRKEYPAEKNLIDYALLISWFPKILSGPIEPSGVFLEKIRALRKRPRWNEREIRSGILSIFWGFFLKLVLAERLILINEPVYTNFERCGGFEIFIASLAYSLRIYCDFEGYMYISRGVSSILGLTLSRNFFQPYFARGIRDFWKRWHVTLTNWFTRYLYIPLGGNRRGKLRRFGNILIVFTISGLWHGANWNFVAWGILHGVMQIAEIILSRNGKLRKLFENRVITFLFVNFAWIFFASNGLKRAIRMIIHAVGTIPQTELVMIHGSTGFWVILSLGLIVLFLVDLKHEKDQSVVALAEAMPLLLRWILYLGLIWSVLLFGIYGPGYDTVGFIYAKF